MNGEQPKKKKVNLWALGLFLFVLAVCIVFWEGGQYYYGEWKQGIYDLGYNQSREDIVKEQGDTGNINLFKNGSIITLNMFELEQQNYQRGLNNALNAIAQQQMDSKQVLHIRNNTRIFKDISQLCGAE